MALDLNDFITESPFKAPPMTIMLYDEKDGLIQSFLAPAGFQYDQYIMALYPNRGFYKPKGQPHNGVLKLFITNDSS